MLDRNHPRHQTAKHKVVADLVSIARAVHPHVTPRFVFHADGRVTMKQPWIGHVWPDTCRLRTPDARPLPTLMPARVPVPDSLREELSSFAKGKHVNRHDLEGRVRCDTPPGGESERVEQLTRTLTNAGDQIDALQRTTASQVERITHLEESVAAHREARSAAHVLIGELKVKIEQLEQQVRTLKDANFLQIQQHSSTINMAHVLRDKLNDQLITLRDENIGLRTALKEASDQAARLADEVTRLNLLIAERPLSSRPTHVVLRGTFGTGFEIIGPFTSEAKAEGWAYTYCDRHHTPAFIAPIETPKED